MSKNCVLLSTYNGERYLRELLDSLSLQEADIIIRDDGSKDGTMEILANFRAEYPDRVEIMRATGNVGVAMSFITLLRYAVSKSYEFFFFCDQDDVWLPEKCSRAVRKMPKASSPALYFSNKKIVDANLQPMSAVDHVKYHGTFWDCFEYSNVYGCTMCLNRAMAEMAALNQYEGKRYLHDAFIYRLALTVGASVIYDDWDSLFYRQHENNVVGSISSRGIKDKIGKDTSKKRKHYVQEMMNDISETYRERIPENNLEIVRLISRYDKDVTAKTTLLKKVFHSEAAPSLKAKLLLKIAGNIL